MQISTAFGMCFVERLCVVSGEPISATVFFFFFYFLARPASNKTHFKSPAEWNRRRRRRYARCIHLPENSFYILVVHNVPVSIHITHQPTTKKNRGFAQSWWYAAPLDRSGRPALHRTHIQFAPKMSPVQSVANSHTLHAAHTPLSNSRSLAHTYKKARGEHTQTHTRAGRSRNAKDKNKGQDRGRTDRRTDGRTRTTFFNWFLE